MRLISALFPLPALSISGAVLAQDVEGAKDHPMFVAQASVGGKALWMQVDINNDGEMYTLTVVEEAPMEQKGEFTPAEMASSLKSAGSAAANLKLSHERAATVKAYLVQTFGVNAARLTTAGLGDTQPMADNGTEEGRAQNRRVVLVRK